MTKIKEICKVKPKDFELLYEDIIKVVSKPKFICSKCLRVSKKKSQVCSPVKIIKK